MAGARCVRARVRECACGRNTGKAEQGEQEKALV